MPYRIQSKLLVTFLIPCLFILVGCGSDKSLNVEIKNNGELISSKGYVQYKGGTYGGWFVDPEETSQHWTFKNGTVRLGLDKSWDAETYTIYIPGYAVTTVKTIYYHDGGNWGEGSWELEWHTMDKAGEFKIHTKTQDRTPTKDNYDLEIPLSKVKGSPFKWNRSIEYAASQFNAYQEIFELERKHLKSEWSPSYYKFSQKNKLAPNEDLQWTDPKTSETPLTASIENERIDLAKKLLKAGVSPQKAPLLTWNSQPFHIAYRSKNWKQYFELLFKYGLERKTVFQSHELLEKAAENGNRDYINFLLDVASNKDAQTLVLKNSIEAATKKNKTTSINTEDFLDFLYEKEERLNIQTKPKIDVLLDAVQAGDMKNVRRLIQKKNVEVNGKGRWDYTALHQAAREGDFEIVRYLIMNGAESNTLSEREQTPLHLAIDFKRGELGKTIHSEDEPGEHEKIAKFLIAKGANVNVKDYVGRTPLFYAAENGMKTVAQKLVAKGASVNTRDDHEKTPLHFAEDSNKMDMVEYLLEQGAKK